jgi:Fn3 associated
MNPLLLTVQNDFVGRIAAEPSLTNVAVFAQRKALTVSEINVRLKTLAGRSGKVGACIMVQMPVLDVVDPDLPGPKTAITQSMLVVEDPTLNAGDKGTGKSAEEIAIAVLQLTHHFIPFGVTQVFVGQPNAIVPVSDLDGLPAYLVSVSTFVQLRRPSKLGRPVISSAAGAGVSLDVTLTGSGSIYYTTDESYPASTNPEATLYTAPFNITEDTTVRAAAEQPGFQQSDIAQTDLVMPEAPPVSDDEITDETDSTITDEGNLAITDA